MLFNRRIPFLIRPAYSYDSLGGFLYGIFWGLSIALLPIVARKMGASDIQMGCVTIAPFVGALFTFPWSHYSRGRRKMPFLIRIKGMGRSLLLLMALAVNPWVFIALVFLYWLLEYAGTPAYAGIMRDIYPQEHRGKAMGYVRVEMVLAMVLSTYGAGYLLNRGQMSYRYVLPLGVVFGLLALASFRRIRVESDERADDKKGRFSVANVVDIFGKDRRFLRFTLIFSLFGFGNLLPLALYPIFLVDNLRVSTVIAGKLSALCSLFWMASSTFWAEYIDKRSPLQALCPIILLAIFTPTLYLLAFNLWFIALAAVFTGIISGGLFLAWFNHIARIATEESIQNYWGIQFSLMGVRGIIAPLAGIGLMHLIGIRNVFLISASMILLSLVLMRSFYQQNLSILKT